MKNKIGVYVCMCGSNISDYVDVEKVKEAALKVEGVELAKTTMFACADSTQQEIANDIKEQKLDAIIVASCSPKLHLFTFRNVANKDHGHILIMLLWQLKRQYNWLRVV